ncbi:hypothetical protein J6590_030130 [Homalodisca vitripennis]|nr:hypothetical protein J6590_030130 [Homalodisca vitripennis]
MEVPVQVCPIASVEAVLSRAWSGAVSEQMYHPLLSRWQYAHPTGHRPPGSRDSSGIKRETSDHYPFLTLTNP